MSFDNRLRDELREAANGHDPREEVALQQVKAAQPTEWADLTVVALEDSPRSQHTRAQQLVGALAACALIAGAIALPLALRSHSNDAGPGAGPTGSDSTCGAPVATGYRSTVVVRVAEAPSTATPPADIANIRLSEPVQLALGLCDRALIHSHLRSDDPGIRFDASTDAAGDLLSLTVMTPAGTTTTALARTWASTFGDARIADAKQHIREQQHQLELRVRELHRELRRVDAQLVKMMPIVYKGVLRFDSGGVGLGRRATGPPPVPEQGSPKALNLAFERIQILSSLTDAGTKAAALRIAVVKPDVYATVISQSPAVLIKAPNHDSNTSTVLLAVGLLIGGALLAGSAFMLGRHTRRSPVTAEAGGSP